MDIKRILSEIPDYQVFLTLNEMNESAFALAEEFPELVTVTELGKSKEGRPLYCLKIGDYSENALVYGCPHPSEVVGEAMLEFFSRKLCEDKAFRDELGYTWYIIKTIDPDGTVLNEGWFKKERNFVNYGSDFFRPKNSDQNESRVPYEHEGVVYGDPKPEVRCLMKVIEEVRPKFYYSLHSAGFGGVYWLMNKDLKNAYPHLWNAVEERDLHLALDQDSGAFIGLHDKAIHKHWTVFDVYQHYKKEIGDEAEDILKEGCECSDYLRRLVPDAFTLICEVPYFSCPWIDDMTPTDMSLGEATVRGNDILFEIRGFVADKYEEIKDLVSPENRLGIAAAEISGAGRRPKPDADKILCDPANAAAATRSAVGSTLWGTRFYNLLYLGVLARTARTEAESGRHTPEQVELLRRVDAEAMKEMYRHCEILESEAIYRRVPIRDLAAVQLASALYCIRELKK